MCWKLDGELMSIGFLLGDVFGDLRFFRRANGDLNLLTMMIHVVLVGLRGGTSVSVLGVLETMVVVTVGARFFKKVGLSGVLESELKRQMLFLRRGCWSCGGRAVMSSDEGSEEVSSWM
jgi:hypothetical protein